MAIRVVVSAEDVAKEAALIIAAKAEEAARKGRPLTIALSGGSTPKALYKMLAAPPYREGIDWESVHLFFGDERCVGPDDEESNFRMVQLNLLSDIEIPARNVHRVKGELSPRDGATRYEEDIKESFKGFDDAAAGGFIKDGLPVFDIILLGLGSDGHTLSIFPGKPDRSGQPDKNGLASLDESGLLVVDTDGPGSPGKEGISGKAGGSPDIRRITMTPRLVNNARLIIFMVCGRSKARAVSRVIDGPAEAGDEQFAEPPASRIRPVSGELLWLLDDKAAALLD